MSDVKHTPGPWEVVRLSNFGPFAIRMRYNAEQTFYGVRQIHRESDANLIAAAPDLYEALAQIDALGSDGEHSGDRHARCRDIARAAISKATGALSQPAAVKCGNCGKPADTKYDGDDMCRDCATYCARRDFEEDDMPGGFA